MAVITARKMDFTIITNWELFKSSFNNPSSPAWSRGPAGTLDASVGSRRAQRPRTRAD